MPIYDFGCTDCGYRFEVSIKLSDKEKRLSLKCPECGNSNVAQIFMTAPFVKSSGKGGGTMSPGGCGSNPTPGCCS